MDVSGKAWPEIPLILDQTDFELGVKENAGIDAAGLGDLRQSLKYLQTLIC